jgi:hypothetical protein
MSHYACHQGTEVQICPFLITALDGNPWSRHRPGLYPRNGVTVPITQEVGCVQG